MEQREEAPGGEREGRKVAEAESALYRIDVAPLGEGLARQVEHGEIEAASGVRGVVEKGAQRIA